jgi:hypothetical protein
MDISRKQTPLPHCKLNPLFTLIPFRYFMLFWMVNFTPFSFGFQLSGLFDPDLPFPS